jgi:hypothetical protein
MAQTIQIRRGTTAEWAEANPILAQGELGLDITQNKFKIGTGLTSWNYLNYGADSVSYATAAGYATSSGIATLSQGLTGTPNISVGIITSTGIYATSGIVSALNITASTYRGSGINLTGIVTSIVAGSNVSISTSTGTVTINVSGGGSGVSEANAIAYSIALG